MILLVTALVLAGAALCYGNKSKWIALQIYLVYIGGSVLLAHDLIHGVSPAAFWAVIALGAGAPLGFLTIVVADARFGLFSLDTFFGIIFIVALAPVLLVANTVAFIWRAVAS